MAIRLVPDSASDITEKEAKELNIKLIPMLISFGDEEYYDGVDLLPDQFYEKLTTSKNLPKTSQITPYRFEKLTANGDERIVITISSKFSGTYIGAQQVAENFN